MDIASESLDSSQSEGIGFVEGVSLRLNPAPLGKRCMAFMADATIITVISYILFYTIYIVAIIGIGISAKTFESIIGKGAVVWVFMALTIVIFLGLSLAIHSYFIYMEHKYGYTLGKKVFGLRVISLDGKRLKWSQLIIRDLMRWYVDLFLFLPGLISILVTDKKQRTGDLAAGTMVIHSKERENEKNYLYLDQFQFLRLKRHIPVLELPEDLAKKYLEFSYKSFQKRSPVEAGQKENWVIELKKYLPSWDEHNLNDDTILLYMAEYCFQVEREKK
jgi:uncharacterized RDD family membrane protein YckC